MHLRCALAQYRVLALLRRCSPGSQLRCFRSWRIKVPRFKREIRPGFAKMTLLVAMTRVAETSGLVGSFDGRVVNAAQSLAAWASLRRQVRMLGRVQPSRQTLIKREATRPVDRVRLHAADSRPKVRQIAFLVPDHAANCPTTLPIARPNTAGRARTGQVSSSIFHKCLMR